MWILMRVGCEVEADYPSEAVIKIDRELAALLLKRRAVLLAVQAYDGDLWEMYFYGSTCAFVGDEADAQLRGETLVNTSVGEQLGRDFEGTANDRPYEVMPDGFVPKYTEACTDIDQVIVSAAGVHFLAYQKHTDFEIRTGEIPWEEIEKAAKADEIPVVEPESDSAPVLLDEETEVWDITFEPEIELPYEQDNDFPTVQRHWRGMLGAPVVDWGYLKEFYEIRWGRWKTCVRVLVHVDDPKEWLKGIQFGSTMMARLTVISEPVRRTIKAGYRRGEMFELEARAGFEFNDALHVFCMRCLDTDDRERVTNQHALSEGEKFTCDRCGKDFIVPPEEEEKS